MLVAKEINEYKLKGHLFQWLQRLRVPTHKLFGPNGLLVLSSDHKSEIVCQKGNNKGKDFGVPVVTQKRRHGEMTACVLNLERLELHDEC